MTDKKKNSWIKFVPSLDLPKERVSIAYDTHDERGVRYAYGHFQFYNGTCGCFWKDGNEQPKVVKAEDIKYWMPVPSLDVQEECNITGIKSKHATGKLKECIDNQTEERLDQARKQLEENPQECMYTKDNYTDEDRKVLCESCEEKCKFNKKEVPVSEDLKEAYERYVDERMALLRPDIADMSCDRDTKMSFDVFDGSEVEAAFYEGVQWQEAKDQEVIETAIHHAYHNGRLEMKEQMMAKAIDIEVKVDAGGYPYISQVELYDYDKDIPLAKEGDKYKVIMIKED